MPKCPLGYEGDYIHTDTLCINRSLCWRTATTCFELPYYYDHELKKLTVNEDVPFQITWWDFKIKSQSDDNVFNHRSSPRPYGNGYSLLEIDAYTIYFLLGFAKAVKNPTFNEDIFYEFISRNEPNLLEYDDDDIPF
jgi:hypothetical protein